MVGTGTEKDISEVYGGDKFIIGEQERKYWLHYTWVILIAYSESLDDKCKRECNEQKNWLVLVRANRDSRS
jgi:hypothetical protein